MVRQWQEFFHGNRYAESYNDSLPDFVKLAEAFGAVGLRCTSPDQVDDVIREMLKVDKPVIVDCVTDQAENVYPMIPGGAAHNEIQLAPDDDWAPVKGVEDGMVTVSTNAWLFRPGPATLGPPATAHTDNGDTPAHDDA
jgi:acetolactate synthase-1/2/3 large subunit